MTYPPNQPTVSTDMPASCRCPPLQYAVVFDSASASWDGYTKRLTWIPSYVGARVAQWCSAHVPLLVQHLAAARRGSRRTLVHVVVQSHHTMEPALSTRSTRSFSVSRVAAMYQSLAPQGFIFPETVYIVGKLYTLHGPVTRSRSTLVLVFHVAACNTHVAYHVSDHFHPLM